MKIKYTLKIDIIEEKNDNKEIIKDMIKFKNIFYLKFNDIRNYYYLLYKLENYDTTKTTNKARNDNTRHMKLHKK